MTELRSWFPEPQKFSSTNPPVLHVHTWLCDLVETSSALSTQETLMLLLGRNELDPACSECLDGTSQDRSTPSRLASLVCLS